MKRKGGQATLESLIEKVYPSREGFVEVRAHRAFARAVPGPLARRAMPARVHRGILYVNAESAAWAQEFQMMAPRLLDAMRRADPALELGSLRFRAGPIERHEAPPPPPPIVPEPVEITAPLAAAIASIRDDAVREVVLEAVRAAASSSAGSGRGRE